jgi:hypothetical protein
MLFFFLYFKTIASLDQKMFLNMLRHELYQTWTQKLFLSAETMPIIPTETLQQALQQGGDLNRIAMRLLLTELSSKQYKL